MSNMQQLIQKIFDSNDENRTDSTKKLIYLAVNDAQTFSPYSAKIAKLIAQSLNEPIDDDQTKKLFLQLLSQLATNYYQHIPTSYYNFVRMVSLLSDDNADVRKAAHYLLLIYIKKYEKIDEVMESYVRSIEDSPEQWKVIQKIIHSFQSLLVIEPKCITYGKNFESMDQFLRLLLAFKTHEHHLIQKASDQTVHSFVKNEYAPQVLPKLNGKIMNELISYAAKLNIKLTINKDNANLLHMDQNQEEDELEQIKISQTATRKSKKRLLFEQCMQKIQNENEWKTKLEVVELIFAQLGTCEQNDIPDDLIDKVLDLTSDYNFKTCITAMNIVLNMVAKFSHSPCIKKDKTQDVIIDKICDLKMAVRQVANKILKKIYDSTPSPKLLNKKILSKLTNCSVVGKQEILSFIQDHFKAEPNELPIVLSEVSQQLMNENTRIKIKTIDCLVKLSFSNNLEDCKHILQKKLNKVYFDMFLERLKEKMGSDANPMIQQNDKNYNKGNMTWQAERTSLAVEPVDKQSMTKVEFGRKVQKSPNMIDTIDDFSYEKPVKKVESFNEKKSSSTLKNKTANTFDTFQSEETGNNFKIVKKNNSVKQGNSFMSQQQYEIEEKKAPLKPNPIKRKVPQMKQTPVQKQDGLVIQSKQYIDKTAQDQSANTSKFSMARLPKRQSLKPSEQAQTRPVPKQPFSIKKSAPTTKKETHQIDYKATYYAAKEELAPLDSTQVAIKDLIKHLPNDNDWNRQFESLNLIRRFIKNHQDAFPLLYEHLPAIMPEVLKLVESLRSTLSKNAMIALVEMCESLKKAMDPFLDGIFIRLFKKSLDANSFIVEEVRKCMTSLCLYCTSSKIVSIIVVNSQTKAIPVKLKVALCVDKILEKKSYDAECLRQNPKIVGIMSTMISDSSAEVRNMTKEAFEQVCRNNPKQAVEEIFRKGGSKESYEKFKKILDKQGKFEI